MMLLVSATLCFNCNCLTGQAVHAIEFNDVKKIVISSQLGVSRVIYNNAPQIPLKYLTPYPRIEYPTPPKSDYPMGRYGTMVIYYSPFSPKFLDFLFELQSSGGSISTLRIKGVDKTVDQDKIDLLCSALKQIRLIRFSHPDKEFTHRVNKNLN